jgi:hypothetical protein
VLSLPVVEYGCAVESAPDPAVFTASRRAGRAESRPATQSIDLDPLTPSRSLTVRHRPRPAAQRSDRCRLECLDAVPLLSGGAVTAELALAASSRRSCCPLGCSGARRERSSRSCWRRWAIDGATPKPYQLASLIVDSRTSLLYWIQTNRDHILRVGWMRVVDSSAIDALERLGVTGAHAGGSKTATMISRSLGPQPAHDGRPVCHLLKFV